MSVEALSIWTVYFNAKDYPGEFVARRAEVSKGGVIHTDDVITSPLLGAIRAQMMAKQLTRLERFAEDEQHIVECWL